MLRDYQLQNAQKAFEIIKKLHIVYLAMEMRVGKTVTALHTAHLYGAKKVLFVTKKKAINSIQADFIREGYDFQLTVTNYEQIPKLKPIYDFYIVDEAHGLGAYPKPSGRAKNLKALIGRKPLVLCSGTPNPETEAQLFHQFWISDHSPFPQADFYKWAKLFVDVKQVVRNGMRHNDYKAAKRKDIMQYLNPYFITFTQSQAGFKSSEVIEKVIEIEIDPNIDKLVKKVMKEKYFKFKDGSEILCDSPVKLQSKIHQIYSGTVKTECGQSKILDESKAIYIAKSYNTNKIAVFYKFVAEGEALKKQIPNWTDSPEEFNNSDDKTFICQVASGSMGVNLSSADVLIFYNIDFSSVQYWQARARLSSLNRASPPIVHWLFSKGGIEQKIYERVLQKKDYTLYYFMKDFGNEGSSNTSKNNQVLKTERSIRNQNSRLESERRA
jgi:hypothetical protein